jgi:general secretion pathway protein D
MFSLRDFLKQYFCPAVPLPMRRFVVLSALVLLSGCAGMQAFREGNTLLAEGKAEQGLAKLEEAVKLAPENAEYRIALAVRRSSIINGNIAAGDASRRDGRLPEAEGYYKQTLRFDPANIMAIQGLDALTKERKHRLIIGEAEEIFKKGGANDLTQAQDKLRSVLSENPLNKEAIALRQNIEEARAKEPKAETKLAANFRRPISLEFRDAPLKTVLEMIAKVSGLNFFYDKDIRADLRATVQVKNTTIEDALQLVLATNQLELKILNDNSVLIFPSTPAKLKDYQTLLVRTFYLTNADVKAVAATIKALVKTKDLVIDERLGIIFMRDTPDAIRMAERIVALQDLSDPEVMLEVEVLEITRSRLLNLGIQWPTQLTLSPLQTSLTLADLKNLSSSNVQASVGNIVINANKQNQDANILANPRIRVRNKEKAKIQIGDRVPVITTTATSTGFVSESVTYLDVGLKLEVEPTIYLDQEVSIKVNLEVSNLVKEVLSKAGSLSYQVGTRGANTVLRLKDGETQILAGLIRDEERSTANRIPILGELPIANRLFGGQQDDSNRSEILLSITPRVVRSIKRPDLLAAEFESGTESNIGSKALRLGAANPLAPNLSRPTPIINSTQPPAAVPSSPIINSTQPPANAQPPAATPPPANPVPPTGGNTAPLPVDPLVPNLNDPAPVTPITPGVSNNSSSSGDVGTSTTSATQATQPTPPPVAGSTQGSVTLGWTAPAQVKVGEEFSAVMRINALQSIKGLPTEIKFDPQALEVVSVKEGGYFKQTNKQTNFIQRVDVAQGKIVLSAGLQNRLPQATEISGAGNVATITFKALRPSAATAIQIVSAVPVPPSSTPLALPIEQSIIIVP